MASSRNSERVRFRYGICLNDNCTKCKSKEVQEVSARKELVCAECGKLLRECPPPKKSSNKLLIIGIVVAVVIVCGVGAYFLFFRTTPVEEAVAEEAVEQVEETQPETLPVDTLRTDTVTEDATPVENEVSSAPATSDQQQMSVQSTSDNVSSSTNKGKVESMESITTLVCGRYEGPTSNGTPNGTGGTVYITRDYTISLKDGANGVVEVSSGDKIVDTKFKDGVLQQGQLIRANGERKYLSGLAERLQ